MKEDIFVKNGLNKTRTTTVSDLVIGRAGGYVRKGGDTIVNAEEYIALRPSGAFISTITDMIKWEMLMQENKILTKENWQKMWTDVVKEDSTNQPVHLMGMDGKLLPIRIVRLSTMVVLYRDSGPFFSGSHQTIQPS